jgi:PGF-pre-PGF domain-containing protein
VLTGGQDSSWYKNDTWRSTDEGATWTQVNASGGWSTRQEHSSVVMPDGSIVLMGGWDATYGVGYKNDTWQSTDEGATWTQVNASAGWSARCGHTSVVLPDGSILLMGGLDINGNGIKNDVWRLTTAGSSAQNPSHTYTTLGTYQVALQAYNAGEFTSTRKAHYITVYLMDDGGSDSGGDIPPIITPSPITSPIGKTITETVNIGGGSAVTRAEVTGTDLGKNLVVTAFPRSSLPSNMSVPQTTVYQFISLTSSTIPGIVNQTTLEFSVPQSWLTEHGFTVGDIVMMHFDNGQWHSLATRYISQNSGNVFYRAITPGLSYFAIVYQKAGTDMGTSITLVTTTVPSTIAVAGPSVKESPTQIVITTEKTQAVPPAPVTNSVVGIPMTTIIVGIIGAIAVIAGAFLVRRWWIRRQNPGLFRKFD